MKTVEGMYRDGKIELLEPPGDVQDEARVIVTFLDRAWLDLGQRGISEEEAEVLRSSLASFVEDWESSEMKDYDDYDAARARAG